MKKLIIVRMVAILMGSLITGLACAHDGHGGGHYGGGHYGGGHYGGYYGGHFHGYGGFYGRPSVGFYFGPGFGWPYYYPYYPSFPYYRYYPYYPYPPAITVPSSPPVYIQRNTEQPAPQPQSSYWYYCRHPNGYYPYVKECPGGWQQVAPQPPR